MKKLQAPVIWVGLLALMACGEEPTKRDGEPGMPRAYEGPGETEEGFLTCGSDAHCGEGEACTQGGLCINVTGEEDVTAVLEKELRRLPEAVGSGVPYRLPANGIFRLSDRDGDGVGLRIDRTVEFDGAGSLFLVENGITAIELGSSAAKSTLRDFRIDPVRAEEAHQGVGIGIRAPGVRLENVYLWRMGTGVFATSELSEHAGGVQGQLWQRLVIEESYENATYLGGDQSAAGLVVGSELIGGGGHVDESRAGSYVGVSVKDGAGSVHLERKDSSSTVTGLMVRGETEAPTSRSGDDVFVGGNAVARVEGPADRVGQQSAMMRFEDSEERGFEVRIPGEGEEAMSWRSRGDAFWGLRYAGNGEWEIGEEGEEASFGWIPGRLLGF